MIGNADGVLIQLPAVYTSGRHVAQEASTTVSETPDIPLSGGRDYSRVVIVAPTFNHGVALPGVLESLEKLGLPIIVVNDGATDSTPEVLRNWLGARVNEGAREVVTHELNQGKAAALLSGFSAARRRGFLHALTFDTDGQHDATDVPALLRLSSQNPAALIVGSRSRVNAKGPLASNVGRAISNRLVWLESGVRVSDSQSGMRVYPLELTARVDATASRYGFETEVLTRAGWLGVAVIETPIRCIYDVPGGRTSHFRIVGDSLRAMGMHASLVARSLLPGPVRLDVDESAYPTGSIPRRLALWFSPRRLWRMARGDAASRKQLAASFGVGMLMATLPLYGIKTAACLWLSKQFRLHPLVVISTSSLSTPPIGFVFVLLSAGVGHLLLRGKLSGFSIETMNTMLLDWAVGSVFAGTALGFITYWLALAALGRGQPGATSSGSGGTTDSIEDAG